MSLKLFVRQLNRSERSRLAAILRTPPSVKVFLRAKAVDLSSQGWKVSDIAKLVDRAARLRRGVSRSLERRRTRMG